MIRPEVIEAVISPPIRGSINSPELVAEAPVTIWRNSGRKMMPPNMPHPIRNPSPAVTEKIRLPKSRSGSVGSGTRDSQATNARVRTTPASPRPMMTSEPQGYSVPPQTNPRTRQLTAVTSSTAPSTSIRCARRMRGGLSTLDVTTSAIAPTGRLMRKTHRHETWSTMKPPSSGPTTLANAKTEPRYPV